MIGCHCSLELAAIKARAASRGESEGRTFKEDCASRDSLKALAAGFHQTNCIYLLNVKPIRGIAEIENANCGLDVESTR